MADPTASNVVVAVTGAVYIAPTGSTAPTDATTALDVAYVNVGYLSEDGITEAYSVDTDEINAWQNADVVRKTVTSVEVTYQFTMIETNSASLALYYGKAVAPTNTDHTIGGSGSSRRAFVIDAIDPSTGQTVRRYIPDGEVSERGEVQLSGSDAVGYEVTITAYPATSLSGDAVAAFYESALA